MWSLRTYLQAMLMESSRIGLPKSLHIRLREGSFTNIGREKRFIYSLISLKTIITLI